MSNDVQNRLCMHTHTHIFWYHDGDECIHTPTHNTYTPQVRKHTHTHYLGIITETNRQARLMHKEPAKLGCVVCLQYRRSLYFILLFLSLSLSVSLTLAARLQRAEPGIPDCSSVHYSIRSTHFLCAILFC